MARNIVITGGTSGLGKALCEKFIKNGDNVFVLSRSAQGENAFSCDVGNKKSVETAFENIKQKVNSIDILINNAGYGVFGALELTSEEETRKIFDTVYFGTLWCIQSALPLMQKGAKIINISSACALFALPFRGLYCASKSAVSLMTFSLRMELEKAGIEVTAICPGNISTNFSKNRVKNFETNEKYGNIIQNCSNRVDKEENNRMTLEYATNKIYKIINKAKLKPQYIIGTKYKILYFASKFVSLKLLLKLTNKTVQN